EHRMRSWLGPADARRLQDGLSGPGRHFLGPVVVHPHDPVPSRLSIIPHGALLLDEGEAVLFEEALNVIAPPLGTTPDGRAAGGPSRRAAGRDRMDDQAVGCPARINPA